MCLGRGPDPTAYSAVSVVPVCECLSTGIYLRNYERQVCSLPINTRPRMTSHRPTRTTRMFYVTAVLGLDSNDDGTANSPNC